MKSVVRIFDRFIDHITMYRLVLYYLLGLLLLAFGFSALHLLPKEPVDLLLSAAIVVSVTYVTNRVFALMFAVPANRESVYITALILILILDPVPASDIRGIGALVFASVWAMASKFIFAVRGKHVFNPAALGVLLPGLLLDHPATWWVGGNLALLPAVLLGGALIVRKLRRLDLVATFIVVELVTVLATAAPAQYPSVLRETFLSSPLLFFAFVMLTEPLTAPTTRWPRLAFAALVGFLFAPNVHIGSFYFTPELALVVGNLFAYLAGPKDRLILTLERIEQSAADSFDFIFSSPRRLAFQAGQYLEWTLGLAHADNRGNRRYFTVASAPTEDEIRLGVKFYPKSSAFKQALGTMEPGDTIHASQLAGDFVLSADRSAKLAFIAGGIGITPFRSMLQYMIDRGEARDVVMLYGTERQEDIAYRDVIASAWRALHIPTYHAVARDARPGQYPGFVDAGFIADVVPDYRTRIFYISGPQPMVQAVRRELLSLGVHRRSIRTDFFPGFA